MLNRGKIFAVLFAALLAVFAAGLWQLFQLRFDAGDVYPPYSSLRADPLGTRAFFEALAGMPDVSVRRHFRGADKLGAGRDTTLFLFGAGWIDMELVQEFEARALETFMTDGGRVVISFLPLNKSPVHETRDRKDSSGKEPDDKEAAERRRKRLQRDEDDILKFVSLHERWAVQFDYERLPQDELGRFETVLVSRVIPGQDLPVALPWHTALFFHQLGGGWTNVYAWDDRPVVIEKKFGRGSLVLSADSYYLSNEALVKEREPALLAWLVGPNRQVIFDEAHLGVVEKPGIATLIRKYRLYGVVLGFVLLAGLFVWKNTVSLVPPHETQTAEADAIVAGRDSAAGFVNLLRRSISAAEVLPVCHAEWSRSARQTFRNAEKARRIRAVVEEESAKPPRQRNPIAAHRQITQILAERK